jgi:hypothetical protein
MYNSLEESSSPGRLPADLLEDLTLSEEKDDDDYDLDGTDRIHSR